MSLPHVLPQSVLRHAPPGGRSYLYRPAELLVHDDGEPRARRDLGEARASRDADYGGALGVGRYRLPAGVDVPGLVRRLRRDGIAAAPNHVVIGAPKWGGHPASPPVPAAGPVPEPDKASGRCTVAVLDTGIWSGHPQLGGRVRALAGAREEEALDSGSPDGRLDAQAGHGTFVSGVVLQVAPSADVVAAKVLDSAGYADEALVAERLLELPPVDVVNLSFGGATADDAGLLAVEAALRALPEETVVVASAGNDHELRSAGMPIHPAALPNVLAVAAVDRDLFDRWQRAWFSNYGTWVDVCAPGVDVTSAFVAWDGPVALGDPDRVERFDGYARWSGTSFAAPVVSGAIAQLVCSGEARSARAATDALLGAGDPVELGRDVDGSGIAAPLVVPR